MRNIYRVSQYPRIRNKQMVPISQDEECIQGVSIYEDKEYVYTGFPNIPGWFGGYIKTAPQSTRLKNVNRVSKYTYQV